MNMGLITNLKNYYFLGTPSFNIINCKCKVCKNKKGSENMFKPIAILYPKEIKRPVFIGYSGKLEGLVSYPPYTVYTSFSEVKTGLKSIEEVHSCIEQEFGKDPHFKWMLMFDTNSLVI